MDKFAHAVTKHNRLILIIFLTATVVSAVLMAAVTINYNTIDYLPKDAQSTAAIRLMEEEFGGRMPNAKVMITNVTVQEALEYKEKISGVEGVVSVSWLDDVIGLDTLNSIPLEFLDASILKSYYKDNNALMSITVESGRESNAVNAIYELIGEDNAAAGEAVNSARIQEMSVSEVRNAMILLLPIIIILLIVTTTSWVEPLLFLSAIGAAVIINMGTNIIFGDISYITSTVSPILQLAVSLDYAIFLLHSFGRYRSTDEPARAMMLAIKEALPTVAASAATTVVGFAALMFMRFGIGSDLGVNLLKGVILSFISVMIFLPALTLILCKAIDKTRHRKLLPDFIKSGGLLMKLRIPFLVLALLIVVPGFLGQANTRFMYGMGNITAASRVGKDTSLIEEKFGRENALALIVPKESTGREAELTDELSGLSHVTGVVSYVTAVGGSIPTEFVPSEAYEQFYSENYSRIILYTDTSEEEPDAFDTVQTVMDIAAKYYDEYYLAGTSATLYDMKYIVSTDTMLINLAAIIGIFVVLLLTFRSLSLPLLLLFTIETAIWINLSIPYFIGQPINFIGYLILSTVQLGATVDYAILFTNIYQNNRRTLPKKEAMKETIGKNLTAVLTSATILACAGFALALTSDNPIISELGTLLGRGTLLSLTMVAFVLPALLVMFDGVVRRTTLKGSKHMKKLLSLILTIVLLSLYAAPAAAAGTPSPKEEVVYGILNQDGSVSSLYVVNIFDGGSITDYGDYTEVRNMTTTEQINIKNDEITINTMADKLYYQGYLDRKELPWNIVIKYYLNDKEIPAAALAGKSGKLKITLAITRNTNIIQSFYENYALQIALTLSSKLCSNIKADANAAIAEAGGKKQISLTVLPGKPLTTSVTADVRDFEMEAITLNAIRLNLDIDIDSSEFSAQISELVKAAEELDGGAGQLLDGLNQLAGGMNDYVEGLKAYKDGVGQLSDGIEQLDDGIAALDFGLKELANQNDILNNGVMLLQQAAFDAVNAQLAGMGLPALTPDNYSQLLSAVPELAAVKLQLDGVIQFAHGLRAYTDGVAQLSGGAAKAAGGASDISDSFPEISGTADTLYNAASELDTAVKSLQEGLASYKEGTRKFKDGTSGMDTEIDRQIDELLAGISGTDEKSVSFVSDKNTNVISLQFVLKTVPITIPETSDTVEPEPVRLSFWQRLLKLFGLYKD